jgi:hypothetical protein
MLLRDRAGFDLFASPAARRFAFLGGFREQLIDLALLFLADIGLTLFHSMALPCMAHNRK